MCFGLTLERLGGRIGLQAKRVAAAAALLHKGTQRRCTLMRLHFDGADPLDTCALG